MKHARLHLLLTFIWAALLIPTLLWWSESVLWIAIMSIYSNLVSHWGAFEAARAEEVTKKLERKLDDNSVQRVTV